MGCAPAKQKKPRQLETKYSVNLTLPLKLCKAKSDQRSKNRTKINSKSFISQIPEKSLTITELLAAFPITSQKSDSDISQINKAIKDHFLFNLLSSSQLKSLAKNFSLYQFSEGSFVFTEGSFGNYFYLISKGMVEVIINGQTKSFLNENECFGELALLHDSFRSASIKVVEDSEIWVLSRENFKKTVKNVSKSQTESTKKHLEKIHFFSPLTPTQKTQVLGLMAHQEFKFGETILSEGDPGDIFYIIKEGLVKCSIDGTEIRRLGPGEYFGEQALLYTRSRTATVSALAKTSVLSLGGKDLVQVFQAKLQTVIYRNSQRIAFERNEFFKCLTPAQVESCIKKTQVFSYEAGKTVLKKGDFKETGIFFVMRGSISSKNITKELFDCLGDKELLHTEQLIEDDYVADTDTDLAWLSKRDFESAIGGDLAKILAINSLAQILKQVSIFRLLPIEVLRELTKKLKEFEFKAGDLVFEQGDPGDSLFIVKEGAVDIVKDGVFLRSVEKNDYFGEKAILFNENRSASAVARANTQVWVLKKKNFFKVKNPAIQDYLSYRIKLQNDSIRLEDLVFVKMIGKGTFGKVYLVKSQRENEQYALKIIERGKVSEYNMFENLINEREILLQLEHPMLMKLVKTFKDDNFLYFLCEYVEGKDLFDFLRIVHKIDDGISRFYIGSCVLALNYLHDKKIVYRDLKPENIVIGLDGYIKIIDFGAAKIVKDKTFTILGTPHYMAPEVILGKGYGVEVDLWSLGAMLYEFVFYIVPFANDETDTMKIYKKILQDELDFPVKKASCKDLVKKLLNKNPVNRGTAQELMKDLWFKGFQWDKLLYKEVKPPFIPDIVSACEKQGVCYSEAIAKILTEESRKTEDGPIGWDKDF